MTKLEPMLGEIHERLAGVTIEQLSYADLIPRYDAAETLFYLDPPYVGCEGDYGDGFSSDEFRRISDQLAGIAGRFVLSINDTPLAREVFGRFQLKDVTVTYMVGAKHQGGTRAGELLVQK